MGVVTIALAVIYPLWGASAALVRKVTGYANQLRLRPLKKTSLPAKTPENRGSWCQRQSIRTRSRGGPGFSRSHLTWSGQGD